jgi:hypothetical protein
VLDEEIGGQNGPGGFQSATKGYYSQGLYGPLSKGIGYLFEISAGVRVGQAYVISVWL